VFAALRNSVVHLQASEILAALPSPEQSRFQRLLERWKAETSHISRRDLVYLHEAYQQIIGMGKEALPFIFRELEQNGGRWFWALKSITLHEPFKGERGISQQRVTQAWLEWAREHGYARGKGESGVDIQESQSDWLRDKERAIRLL
jgi:hypothetical protein